MIFLEYDKPQSEYLWPVALSVLTYFNLHYFNKVPLVNKIKSTKIKNIIAYLVFLVGLAILTLAKMTIILFIYLALISIYRIFDLVKQDKK